jgi:hypothetical protein
MFVHFFWNACQLKFSHLNYFPLCFKLLVSYSFFFQATCQGGCSNGGTCVAPNTCQCAYGWSGASTNCNARMVNPFSFLSSPLLFSVLPLCIVQHKLQNLHDLHLFSAHPHFLYTFPLNPYFSLLSLLLLLFF